MGHTDTAAADHTFAMPSSEPRSTSEARMKRKPLSDARSLLVDRAHDAGMTAAIEKRPYSDNPHDSDPELRLAWSRGHNGMRARLAMDADEKGAGPK